MKKRKLFICRGELKSMPKEFAFTKMFSDAISICVEHGMTIDEAHSYVGAKVQNMLSGLHGFGKIKVPVPKRLLDTFEGVHFWAYQTSPDFIVETEA